MGCDIHLFIEYKGPESKRWFSFGKKINPGRIYGMFAKLADVRNDWDIKPISQPRGIPEDMASNTFDDYTYFITETESEEYVTPEKAAKWVQAGYSKYFGNGRFVSGPDWHSESWCTADELEQAINDIWKGVPNGNEVEWIAVLDVLRSFERQGQNARIVFWFDN